MVGCCSQTTWTPSVTSSEGITDAPVFAVSELLYGCCLTKALFNNNITFHNTNKLATKEVSLSSNSSAQNYLPSVHPMIIRIQWGGELDWEKTFQYLHNLLLPSMISSFLRLQYEHCHPP